MPGPRFELCETCGKHGRVVGADGFYSCEVYSKEYARYSVKVGIQHGTLKSGDLDDLYSQIAASRLPRRDKEVDDETKRKVLIWNMARCEMQGDNTSPDQFHPTLEEADRIVSELAAMGPGLKVIDLRSYNVRQPKPH